MTVVFATTVITVVLSFVVVKVFSGVARIFHAMVVSAVMAGVFSTVVGVVFTRTFAGTVRTTVSRSIVTGMGTVFRSVPAAGSAVFAFVKVRFAFDFRVVAGDAEFGIGLGVFESATAIVVVQTAFFATTAVVTSESALLQSVCPVIVVFQSVVGANAVYA